MSLKCSSDWVLANAVVSCDYKMSYQNLFTQKMRAVQYLNWLIKRNEAVASEMLCTHTIDLLKHFYTRT